MQSDEKEIWIEGILETSDAIQRVSMPQELRETIIKKLQAGKKVLPVIQISTVWGIAAGIAILIVLNISTLLFRDKPGAALDTSVVNPLVSEYFTNPPAI